MDRGSEWWSESHHGTRKALTRMGSPPYHGEMTQRLHIAAGVLFFAASILGCEDAGKKPAQAHVAALAPAPRAANAKQAAVELAPLPILNPPRRHYVWLLRSEEHTSELQSLRHLVCRLLLEKKKKKQDNIKKTIQIKQTRNRYDIEIKKKCVRFRRSCNV